MATAFNNYLQAEVGQISQRERLSADKAFLFWFAVSILDLTEDAAREAISIEGANDKGIATLIRQPDFCKKVMDRAGRQYERDARASNWLKEALPPINLKIN